MEEYSSQQLDEILYGLSGYGYGTEFPFPQQLKKLNLSFSQKIFKKMRLFFQSIIESIEVIPFLFVFIFIPVFIIPFCMAMPFMMPLLTYLLMKP
jgi:hypothetical protein